MTTKATIPTRQRTITEWDANPCAQRGCDQLGTILVLGAHHAWAVCADHTPNAHGCVNKVTWSEATAEEVATRMRAGGRPDARAYCCALGRKHWHTSSRQRR